jgi:hypothetical protein
VLFPPELPPFAPDAAPEYHWNHEPPPDLAEPELVEEDCAALAFRAAADWARAANPPLLMFPPPLAWISLLSVAFGAAGEVMLPAEMTENLPGRIGCEKHQHRSFSAC